MSVAILAQAHSHFGSSKPEPLSGMPDSASAAEETTASSAEEAQPPPLPYTQAARDLRMQAYVRGETPMLCGCCCGGSRCVIKQPMKMMQRDWRGWRCRACVTLVPSSVTPLTDRCTCDCAGCASMAVEG